MKVSITTRAVHPFHGFGGMEKYFYNLAKSLTEQGIDVEIVTSFDGTGRKNRVHKGIKYTFLPPNFNQKPLMSLWYPLFNRNVKRYLEKSTFDILHGTGGVYPYVLLKSRKPVIAQEFGLEPFRVKGLEKIYHRILTYRSTKLTFEHADAIASIGDSQTRDIISLFQVSPEKIFKLSGGVDLDLVNEYTSSVEIAREDLGIQDADLVLMNVNRLVPHKGVPFVIDALKILNERLNVKLILVGTGSQEREIKKQIKRLKLEDKVIHFKNISDKKMFQLYTLTDISITPGLMEEGLYLTILEAMAMEKPIVATNVSIDIPQVVKEGENGFLFSPINSKAIADAVLKIYDGNLFERMGRKSREIVNDYDWNTIAKKAIEEYERLIKNSLG